jgi:spore coat protein H
MRRHFFALLALALSCDRPAPPDESDQIFDQSFVHEIDLTVSPGDLAQLSPDNDLRVPCTFRFDGVVLEEVGVRLKTGAGSRRELTEKAGFSLKFDEFVNGQLLLGGVKKLTLGNAVEDDSFIAEQMAFEVFRAAGIPAPRTAYANVSVNGELFGLYVIREAIDKRFLAKNFADNEGNLYEGSFRVDVTDVDFLSLDTNEQANDRSDIIALSDAVFSAPAGQFTAQAETLVDLDEFFTYWAVEAVIYHWDGYAVAGDFGDFSCCSPNNYYVYHDPTSDRLLWLPHGADMTFGIHRQELGELFTNVFSAPDPRARFATRLFAEPGTQERLAAAVEGVLAAWDTEALLAKADLLADLVRQEGFRADREETSREAFEQELALHRQFIAERKDIVLGQLGL